MKGDFSRSTFDPRKHYTSVRMQQGRVQLDADWNEHADILLHLIQTELADMLGPGATAAVGTGFVISSIEPGEEQDVQPSTDEEQESPPARALPDFWIGSGRYYVDGILCENEADVRFSQQPDYPAAESVLQELAGHNQYIVYLDVWPRHITAVEDPAIRETALGGPDTTTRLKTIWQVNLLPLTGDQGLRGNSDLRSLDEWTAFVQQASQKRRLIARWNPTAAALENRLYRVEIHSVKGDQVTFKWSRENGSVVFPVTRISAKDLLGTLRMTVEGLDRDPYQLKEGSWVELVDDVTLLNGHSLPLCRVTNLDLTSGNVTLQAEKDKLDEIWAGIGERKLQNPLLRRWENDGDTIVHPKNPAGDQAQWWLDLENGIQIAFGETGTCQVGDYWLISARAQSETGIEWPQERGQPRAQTPHGIRHHYAPLALFQFQAGSWSVRPAEPGVFQTLPQVTEKLSTSEVDLKQIQETVGRLDQLTHEFSSLVLLQKTVDNLAQQTHVFETVRSEDQLERGDVVALDRIALEQIGATDQDVKLPVKLASSTDRGLVMGVVWESLEEKGDSQLYRIAIQGRARCKVLGPVEPGDLLVPSDKLGYARKAGWPHWPGTAFCKVLGFTTFEPAVMDEIEESTLTAESGLRQQPGAVDVMLNVEQSTAEKRRLPVWVVAGVLGTLAVLALAFFLLFWPNLSEVPQVAGLPEAVARATIEALGLLPERVGEEYSSGNIVWTTPQAGMRVGKNTPVGYILSAGLTPTETPTPTLTNTPTNTPTSTPTNTPTFTPTNTPSPLPCARPATLPIAWWPGNGNANDVAGSNNEALIDDDHVTFKDAVVSKGFQIQNGVVGVVSAPGEYHFQDTNEITIETWFRLDSPRNYNGIISAERCCTYRILIDANGHILYNPGTHTDITINTTILPNEFHHVAMTVQGGGSARIYLDGQMVWQRNNGVPQILPNVTKFLLGAGEETNFWVMQSGFIDEATIYNRALSSTEILEIYQAGSWGKCQAP